MSAAGPSPEDRVRAMKAAEKMLDKYVKLRDEIAEDWDTIDQDRDKRFESLRAELLSRLSRVEELQQQVAALCTRFVPEDEPVNKLIHSILQLTDSEDGMRVLRAKLYTEKLLEAAEAEAEKWEKAYRDEFDNWNAGNPCGHVIRTAATIPDQPYNTCSVCQMFYWKAEAEKAKGDSAKASQGWADAVLRADAAERQIGLMREAIQDAEWHLEKASHTTMNWNLSQARKRLEAALTPEPAQSTPQIPCPTCGAMMDKAKLPNCGGSHGSAPHAPECYIREPFEERMQKELSDAGQTKNRKP